MKDLAKLVLETITRHRMIVSGDDVLLGVSGGADSVALLNVLDELKDVLGCTLAVAHFDHGIRGEEGCEDALFTQKLAARLELPFHLGRNEGRTPIATTGGNLESHARDARYRFLDSVATQGGLKKIAVGHTRDDQVETMLMWLLRGCGPSGLGGMPAVRPVSSVESGNPHATLIRPLLDVPRADIIQYLEQRGASFREDSTNADTRYLRNWIRADLLPELVKRTDERLKLRLGRLSSLLQSDDRLLDQYVSRVYPDVVDAGVLSRDAFLNLDLNLRPRVLRLWIRRHLGDLQGTGFQHVDSLAQLIGAQQPSGRVSLPRGWTVIRNYDALHLIREAVSGATDAYSYELPDECEFRIPEVGATIKSWCSSRAEAVDPRNLFKAIFDRAVIKGTPRLRNRRHGDRFQPLGMSGHKKVKALFIQKKVSRLLRGQLPLLLVEDEVLWIPGCGRSDYAQVHEGTREVWNVVMSPVDLARSGSY